jgi:ATP-binding cassette subfamily C protein
MAKFVHPDTLRVFSAIGSRYPWQAAGVVLGLMAANLVDAISILSIFPVLVLLTDTGSALGDQGGVASLIRTTLDSLGIPLKIAPLLLIMVVAVWLKSTLVFLTMRQVTFVAGRMVEDLRIDLIRGLMEARWSYFISQPVGKLANSIGNEVSRASSAVMTAGQISAAAMSAALHLALAFLVSWQVALAALALGSVAMVILRPTVSGMRKVSVKQTEMERSLAARFADGIQGIKPLKAMDQVSHLLRLLERDAESLYANFRNRATHKWLLSVSTEPIVITMMAIGLIALTQFASLTLPSLAVLAVLFVRTMEQMSMLQKYMQSFVSSESALLSLDSDIKAAQSQAERHAGTKAPTLRGRLRLENVVFRYGAREVLSGVNMQIDPGNITALIGPSGSGKSTILDLILGLQSAASGRILLDDMPLEEIDISLWRRSIGYVPQDLFLFHDTVAVNVSLGDTSVTRDDIVQALRMAGALDFVQSMEAGIDTIIGERGLKLSGGQRQRIAIARAMVRRPALLVLDEATTALDPTTERGIFETLRSLHGNVSILAISHQRSLIDQADRLYELENGTAIERDRSITRRQPTGAP